MIIAKLMECVPTAIVGAMLLLTPNLTRRGLLFAVPVPPGFAASPEAHHAVAAFRRTVAVVFFIALLMAWQTPLLAGTFPVFLLLAAAGFSFYRAHRLILPFRAPAPIDRSLDLLTAPGSSPARLSLSTGPFLPLARHRPVASRALEHHPRQFPVHWAADGSPNGWSGKSFKGVYGPLLFAAETCAFLVIFGCASWFGARRSTARASVLSVMVAVEYSLAVTFGALVPLQALYAVPAGSP